MPDPKPLSDAERVQVNLALSRVESGSLYATDAEILAPAYRALESRLEEQGKQLAAMREAGEFLANNQPLCAEDIAAWRKASKSEEQRDAEAQLARDNAKETF